MDLLHPPWVTAAEMREMDRAAIEEFGVPGVVLMENAGAGAARVAVLALGGGKGRVALFAGRGNNGGDAFVAARHLANRGCDVTVHFVGDAEEVGVSSDAGINLHILKRSGVPVLDVPRAEDLAAALSSAGGADLIVDGLLGTGTRGAVREPYGSAIDGINGLPVPVLSLDLPSGLDPDTGQTLGACVRAAHTATFGLPKKGLFAGRGPELCGTVHLVDIGMPVAAMERVLDESARRNEALQGPPAVPESP